MIAADFSNWQRVPTPEDIAALKALGVTRVIVGTSFGTHWVTQLRVCEEAGFEVQEYMFIGRFHPTQRAWWLDVELSETVDEIRTAVAKYHPDGIYTRRGIWQLLGVDLVSEFPGLKLWDANYGPLPRTFTPYGGWTKADMTQWRDTMDIGTGFAVDLNEYEEDEMAVDAYTKAETDAKVGALLLQVGKLGADLRNLTSDVQGTFRYAYEHATNSDVHSPGTLPIPAAEDLEAKIDELQRRLDAGADELRQAAAALGGK